MKYLHPVAQSDKTVLDRLMELYLYDLSEFDETLVQNAHGEFGYPWLDHYWTDEGRYPYFIHVEGAVGGFALVRQEASNRVSMAEFFVLRRYRRTGVSTPSALEVFSRHPGSWVVRHSPHNSAAAAFWPRVIEKAAHGAITRIELADGDIEYTFAVPT